MRTVISCIVVSTALMLFYAPAQAAGCLSLQTDLGYGMSDAATNGQVSLLQQYLKAAGYLSAAPNGYFGQGTLAAVKTFQSSQSIPNNGRVGPLTRAALRQLTCAAANPSQPQPAVPLPTPPAAAASIITAPQNGQTLTTGQAFTVSWSAQPYARYDLLLMSSNGAGAGFIASSLTGANQYLWTAGQVFSSQTQSTIAVPPGTYQVRMQDSVKGSEPGDPVSGVFTIAAPTLTISSVSPASVPADGHTAVVLYGSGFDASTAVSFSASGLKGQVLYVSADGKVLVFSIPGNVPAGAQSVYVTDPYFQSQNQPGSLLPSQTGPQSSNQLSFTIVSP